MHLSVLPIALKMRAVGKSSTAFPLWSKGSFINESLVAAAVPVLYLGLAVGKVC
jgi:hypothetical protein